MVGRVGAVMNRTTITGCVGVGGSNTFVRMVDDDKILQRVRYNCGGPWFVLVRTELLPSSDSQAKGLTASYQIIDCDNGQRCNVISSSRSVRREGMVALASASVVVAGGRCFGSREVFVK